MHGRGGGGILCRQEGATAMADPVVIYGKDT
jgi:hypothetical protein